MNTAALAMVAIAVANTTGPAQSRDTIRVDVGRGSQVWIQGSSNVVDWRCQATAFEAMVEVDAFAQARDGAAIAGLRGIDVRVAVRDLKCGNRKMEHDLYAALKATDLEQPKYIIGRFEILPDSTGSVIAARGPLNVSGVERSVTVTVTTRQDQDGRLRARGAVQMLMTDFGIKPPVGLFGLIRSRNEITVEFDLVVPPRSVAMTR
jgi:hypothetical protein